MSSQLNNGISGTSAGVAGVTAAVLGQMAHAQGSDKIKVGMLGCGGRGRGAMQNCLDADPAVEIIAMADLFEAWRGDRKPAVLDVRQPAEWAEEGSLPEATRVFLADVPSRLGLLRDRGPWWTVCASGLRAATAASLLDAAGVPPVLVGREGMSDWIGRFQAAGGSIVRG
jgi:rhodanese-related sulfurtransferase